MDEGPGHLPLLLAGIDYSGLANAIVQRPAEFLQSMYDELKLAIGGSR